MQNFSFHNPVKIVFGKGTIKELSQLIPKDKKVMVTYGGGSIKKNGVYDQVMNALKGYSLLEFSGIEPNPLYETCMKAVELARAQQIDFLLSVGGGSVLDATKFISAVIPFAGTDPWRILTHGAPVKSAVPLGCVLTLPATGSEMNTNAVISRASTEEKLAFSSKYLYPQFSILDPATTFSLPDKQVANGIVDAFVHVCEQYLTYNMNAPLQDRMAEAILLTLIEEAPKVKANPTDYDVRASIMWCATMALNGLIGKGVPQDWTTHQIGHEITALHGLDHAQTLAIILPAVMKHQQLAKKEKLVQYAERVWGISSGIVENKIDAAISKTKSFFESVGNPSTLKAYGLTPIDCKPVVEKLKRRGAMLGEHRAIGPKEVEEILELAG
jgi:NADP-dependent alcohol dehydrogenase